MTARFATQQEIADWNSHIIANPDGGNIFASHEYALQKETGGYKARFAIVDGIAITILEKFTPPLGKLWYLPKGPEVTTSKELWTVLDELKALAKKHRVFLIRIESELRKEQQPTLARHGLLPAKSIIPNPSTITIAIDESLEVILERLPQKGRYAIKRAERDGVTVERVKASDTNCRRMYHMLEQTAEGQFGIRSYDYYHSFWQRFEKAGYGQMFFAYVDKKVVASAYAMTFGAKSTYKDGASIRKRTAYGASHLLQWQVIAWAKEHGSLLHDFMGSPPSEEINNPEHPHHGVGLFKTAFNKTVTDYVGCYDLVLSPAAYKAWTSLGNRIAHRLHWYKFHDSYF